MLHLFDTALGRVAPLEPAEPGRFTMYVCGPTVSGEPHLGHARFTVVWDIVRRYLTWSGLEVRFVSNVTDIEDKIIAKASADGRSTTEVAADYEKVWWETQTRLGVERPTSAPHATEYVEQMVELIERLVDRGSAYVAGDGVYFSAESVDSYGLLARQSLESLRSGASGRVAGGEESDDVAGKRSPVDFVLWKLAKPGEPSWPSPWGDGRPGWHTECVVMSLDLLGEGFDLHTGGLDLAFPHHENERAQAVAAGKHFARRWAHNGMVVDEGGQKMSKSVGNTLSLTGYLDAYDPRAFRLQVLMTHYRRPMSVSESSIAAAAAGVERLDAFAREFDRARDVAPDSSALEAFTAQMDDDLDTPAAVAGGFDLVRLARSAATDSQAMPLAAAAFEIFEEALGLPMRSDVAPLPPEALAKAKQRDEARAAKDYALADRLRSDLQAEGWTVEDGPEGTTIR